MICVGFVEHSSVMLTIDASGQMLKWPYRKEYYSEVAAAALEPSTLAGQWRPLEPPRGLRVSSPPRHTLPVDWQLVV